MAAIYVVYLLSSHSCYIYSLDLYSGVGLGLIGSEHRDIMDIIRGQLKTFCAYILDTYRNNNRTWPMDSHQLQNYIDKNI